MYRQFNIIGEKTKLFIEYLGTVDDIDIDLKKIYLETNAILLKEIDDISLLSAIKIVRAAYSKFSEITLSIRIKRDGIVQYISISKGDITVFMNTNYSKHIQFVFRYDIDKGISAEMQKNVTDNFDVDDVLKSQFITFVDTSVQTLKLIREGKV